MSTRRFAENSSDKLLVERDRFDELLRRRFFISQSFQIYRGVAGLYDYGPPGSAVKNNLVSLWRNHFVIHDSMLELDCTCLTPKVVLDVSGHTAKFSDLMVRDEKTKACYRADHVLKGHLEVLLSDEKTTAEKKKEIESVVARIDDLSPIELAKTLKTYDVRAPDTGNELSEPMPFNLMFQTSIGPTGDLVGFLRPETAQGIFVNFKRIVEFNGGRLPVAAAQIGQAFRNEIAPRSGLLRVREFTLAEIEYFVHPENKDHVNYEHTVVEKNAHLPLFSSKIQLAGESPIVTSVKEAVENGTIHNKALGYYMTRTYLFLLECGIPAQHIRFRQHLPSEMAHYASDCWDAEVRTSYGWIECVGHADRTCFDLERHANGSKVSMSVHEEFKDGAKIVKRFVPKINKGSLGKLFRKDAQVIIKKLESLTIEESEIMAKQLEEEGKIMLTVDTNTFELTKDSITFVLTEEKVTGISYTPHVIEPSFGIGRILYCLLEHAYWYREDDHDKGILSLPPFLAPYKVSVFPLQQDKKLQPCVHKIHHLLSQNGISHKVDETGQSIGKRYARTDELGIPFAITVDYDSIANGVKEGEETVTLRERDSCAQVRIPVKDLCSTLTNLSNHLTTWERIVKEYPAYETEKEK